jgi:hypothetical protein
VLVSPVGDRAARLTQRLDAWGDVRQGIEQAHESSDLLLGPVLGSSEHLDQILFGEMRAEHQKTGEVKLPRGDGAAEERKAAHQASGGDPAISFVLRETQLVDAIGVQTRAGAAAMDAASFDLGKMQEQGGEQLVRTTDEQARCDEQLRVREV